MYSITKTPPTPPINIKLAQDSNIPPNSPPPFKPSSDSPNSYYLEMLDIMYKKFNYSSFLYIKFSK